MRSSFGKWIQAAFWVTLLVSNIYFGALLLGWPEGLYRGILTVLCHLINFYAFYSLLVPVYYEKKKYTIALAGGVALLVALTPLRIMIENRFMLEGRLLSTLGDLPRLGFVAFTEIAIASFASLMRLAVSNERTKQRLEQLSKLHVESELKFLKAQINPHFLFNTVNNIYSLTLTKSDKAPEALMKLSGLLRYLLYESNEKVPLEKEIDALRNYAELFQLKYEHPVNLNIEIDIEKGATIEPQVLVPILENALKHSGLGIQENSNASMSVEYRGGILNVNCVNSKMTSSHHDGPGGIGLANIKKRLDMAYGEACSLTTEDSGDLFQLNLTIRP